MSAKFPRGGGAGPFLARSLHLAPDHDFLLVIVWVQTVLQWLSADDKSGH